MTRQSRRAFLLGAGTLALAGTLPATGQEVTLLRGRAFGGTWQVSLPNAMADPNLCRDLAAILATIDAQMSPFRADSELSRFNLSHRTGRMAASAELCAVAGEALRIATRTGGAFDPTVGPSVARFGFGPIVGARDGSYAGLEVLPDGLGKAAPDLTIDLCGIAKGHALDRLAVRLRAGGASSFLIEVGGEVLACGAGADDRAWRVGIEHPGTGEVHCVLDTRGLAIATSGDAINAYAVAGRRYSHIIDPATHEPVRNAVASVSVLTPNGAEADALATALMVMGPERGIAFAEAGHLPVLFLLHGEDGTLREVESPTFTAHRIG
jgi:thiamine biosynthesis lipoprotein